MSWEGYGVSVRCGALGCYQGTILAADGDSITLTKPFRNGFPYPKAQVTLKATDIKSLEIISGRAESAPAHSTVVAGGKRRGARASVGESLQAPAAPAAASAPLAPTAPSAPTAPTVPTTSTPNAGGEGAGGGGTRGRAAPGGQPGQLGGQPGQPTRSKPIDIQGSRSTRNNTHSGSYGCAGSTPKGRAGGAGGPGGGGPGGGGGAGGDKARRRNEACFGACALHDLHQDFDFEGNLALFDKQALWQQMRPDVVPPESVGGAGPGGGGGGGGTGKLRHDQNVLRAAPPDTEPVHVPIELRGPVWYVTDGGVRVPSLSADARRRLWSGLVRAAPHVRDVALALLARATADVALRLVGGTRRLDPRNAHQRPTAGVAVGSGAAAAAAVTAARLLHAHGVDTYVVPPAPDECSCGLVRAALAAYASSGGRVLPGGAPRPPADLLVLALHDPTQHEANDKYRDTLEWGSRSRGALILVEPAGDSSAGAAWSEAVGCARAALCALLPGALGGPDGAPGTPAPRLLLANVAPPRALFAALGVAYRPPFGAAALLPLHPADD